MCSIQVYRIIPCRYLRTYLLVFQCSLSGMTRVLSSTQCMSCQALCGAPRVPIPRMLKVAHCLPSLRSLEEWIYRWLKTGWLYHCQRCKVLKSSNSFFFFFSYKKRKENLFATIWHLYLSKASSTQLPDVLATVTGFKNLEGYLAKCTYC